jgi:hypothetical protein
VSATLEILNSFSMETQGRTLTGKQGTSTDLVTDAKEITVDGTAHDVIGSLATATGKTVWDEDDDVPADWDYLYFWADQDCYLQLIGQTTQVSLPIKAGVPHTQYGDQILAAANTTALVAAPSLEDIDSVRIWNESGNTMNYHFAVID